MEYTKDELIEHGTPFITPSQLNDWNNYVEFNFKGVNQGRIAMAAFTIIEALANNQPFDECKLLADKYGYTDEAAYHTLISGVVRFADRGPNYLRHTDKTLAIKLSNWLDVLDNVHLAGKPQQQQDAFAKMLKQEKPKSNIVEQYAIK